MWGSSDENADHACAERSVDRFESDIFNYRSVVQPAERPSDMRKVNGANPFTSTWDTDSRYVDALHLGPYNTRLIIVPKCILNNNVTLTANIP